MKSVKITREQLLKHRAKHGRSAEEAQEIKTQQEIKLYGRDARKAKELRKRDIRELLSNKNTRPKGAYYDPELKSKAIPEPTEVTGRVYIIPKHKLGEVFKIDENQTEALDEQRIDLYSMFKE